MADISTDALIIGTGPAGSASAALLSSYGVENMVINLYLWLANTPRAHITNQRTMEVLRNLGPEVEAEAYLHATPKELMGNKVFCESLAGEELGRLQTWGTHPVGRRTSAVVADPDERPAANLHGTAAVQNRLFARRPGADVDRISAPRRR